MTQVKRVLLFVAFLVLLPSQFVILVEDPGTYPYILAAQRQSAAVQKAMRFHGTTQAYSDGTTWYFHDTRGKVCRLFNRSYQTSAVSRPDRPSRS